MHKLSEPQSDDSSAERSAGALSTALLIKLRKHGLVHEHSLAAAIAAHVDIRVCLSPVSVRHAETA
jgi:hypothetical protein